VANAATPLYLFTGNFLINFEISFSRFPFAIR